MERNNLQLNTCLDGHSGGGGCCGSDDDYNVVT